MRSHDWTASPLGPPQVWPQSLRTAVGIMLNSRHPMFIAWDNPTLTFLYNDGYAPLLGAKHPAAVGRPFSEVWSDIWSAIEPLVQRALAGEPTWSENLQLFMNRSGYLEETYFTFSYSPVYDETGGVGGMFCAVTETTAAFIGERRLKTLSALSTASADAKATSVAEGYRHCLAALETNPSDVPFAILYDLGDGPARLLGSFGVDAVVAEDTRAWPLAELARGEPHVVEELPSGLAAHSPWGDPIRGAIAFPISRSGVGTLKGLLVIGINPRRRFDENYRLFVERAVGTLEAAIANAHAFQIERRRAETLAEVDRAKTAFFSNVSHEFRTPLTLMLGPIDDALAERSLPAGQRERLLLAQRNALRLLKLVNTLLDFSRIEAGRVQANYQPTDLAAHTVELASNFHSATERAGLRLVVDCPPLPVPVHVDRDMWETIVLNLISNAFKFTFAGEIIVSLRAVAGRAELSVRDTGVGIPEHELPRLFERFHRIEGQDSRTYEGSGIGLALVQELVRLHGGSVRVDSRLGIGSTFVVGVPFGTGHLPQDRIARPGGPLPKFLRAQAYVDEAIGWLSATAARAAEAPADTIDADNLMARHKGARVLLADDNADMRGYVGRLLGAYAHIEMVADGEAALTAIRARRPDLVLADVMMPRLDGFGLLRAIRSDPQLRDLQVIMLSARAGEEARVEGLQAGADDYLVKPFSARGLIARVTANLELAHARREAMRALRESEARFRALVQAGSEVVYRMSPDWREMRQLRGLDFIADTDEPSRSWLDKYIPPEDQPRVLAAIRQAVAAKGVFELEHQVLRVDGSLGWAFSRALPILDERGEIVEWFGAATDITERKRYEEHQQMLVNELNHRVKNTLVTVQSFAMQSFRHAQTLSEGRERFEARLLALAKAHDVLTRENWQGAGLREVVAEALAPHAREKDDVRFEVEGPELRLQPKAALALALVLHELATNAVKYGALSIPAGRVRIRWQVEENSVHGFSLRWEESGGPPVVAPRRRGFGSKLIEQGLAQDLAARVNLRFAAQGLLCTLDAPLAEVKADDQD